VKKGVTLIETLIVLVIASLIMPFLFRMITISFNDTQSELANRANLNKDLSFVLEKDREFINKGHGNVSVVVSGQIIEELVLIGE